MTPHAFSPFAQSLSRILSLNWDHFLSSKKMQSIEENFHSFYHYFLSYLHFSLYTLVLFLFHRWILCVLDKDQTLHSGTIFLTPPHTSDHYGSISFLLLHHLMCPSLVSSYLFPFSVEPTLRFHPHASPEIALIKATSHLPTTNSSGHSQYWTCQCYLPRLALSSFVTYASLVV